VTLQYKTEAKDFNSVYIYYHNIPHCHIFAPVFTRKKTTKDLLYTIFILYPFS
jgi:hypothetical protein